MICSATRMESSGEVEVAATKPGDLTPAKTYERREEDESGVARVDGVRDGPNLHHRGEALFSGAARTRALDPAWVAQHDFVLDGQVQDAVEKPVRLRDSVRGTGPRRSASPDRRSPFLSSHGVGGGDPPSPRRSSAQAMCLVRVRDPDDFEFARWLARTRTDCPEWCVLVDIIEGTA